MSLIGQPENYSDILKRIFTVTLAAGVLCTFALAAASPAARIFLESWKTETSIGILDSVKALYVLIPIILATVSRVFLLHDRISDLLGIRRDFDLKYILRPLARGVGFPETGAPWRAIQRERRTAIARTFYCYASFEDPKIDFQMVRAAADRWAWFWCTVEPQVILLIAAVIFLFLRAWPQMVLVLVTMAILTLIGCILWPQMQRGARTQVQEILAHDNWRGELLTAFQQVVGITENAAQPRAAADGAAPPIERGR